jgi:hypothetical protein
LAVKAKVVPLWLSSFLGVLCVELFGFTTESAEKCEGHEEYLRPGRA